MPEFEIIDVEETPYLYVERSCSHDPKEIAEAMGSAFGEVWAFMQSQGIAPAGGALSVYYSYDPDVMAFRSGFTIARDDIGKASGPVKADVTPKTRAVHGTHIGPYAGIRQSYGEMHAYVQAQGVEFTPPTWEIYMNSPDQVPESDLVTELYQTLA